LSNFFYDRFLITMSEPKNVHIWGVGEMNLGNI